MEDLAGDVVAGVDFLRSRPEVNSSAIGLLGHSFGADIAPLAATQTTNVAFLILMSGSATPLYKGIYEQCRLHYGDIGVSEKGIALNEKVLKVVFEAIRKEKDNAKAAVRINKQFKILNTEIATLPEKERKLLELPDTLQATQFSSFLSPAMRTDLYYDSLPTLRKITIPVLALNGSVDKQVHPANLPLIGQALQQAGNKQFTIHEFPDKNHLFQHTKTGSIAQYSLLEETMSEQVIDFIIDWIVRQTK
jgi:pimeloyl-ACP methyl ester carboxylesterase